MASRIRSLFLLTSLCINITLIKSSSSTISTTKHYHEPHDDRKGYQGGEQDRKLDISRSCQEELTKLRQAEEFQVKFPTLSETEFTEHCNVSSGFTEISCELDGTTLVDSYRRICEDNSGGKIILMNMTASGACVDNVNVTFYNFPLCAGRSCDANNFIESYEEKLKTEVDLIGEECHLDLVSGTRQTTIPNFMIILMATSLIVVFIVF